MSEALWAQTRERLIEGLAAALADPQSYAYERAKSDARLRGFADRAASEASWKAEAVNRALDSSLGPGLWAAVEALEEAGESWAEAGPLVFQEWLALLDKAAERENPFRPSSLDQKEKREGSKPWLWLSWALQISQAGFKRYGGEGPMRASRRAPLGEAEQEAMARVFLKFRSEGRSREAKSEASGEPNGYARAVESVFNSGGYGAVYWASAQEAEDFFEALDQKRELGRVSEKGKPGGRARRV